MWDTWSPLPSRSALSEVPARKEDKSPPTHQGAVLADLATSQRNPYLWLKITRRPKPQGTGMGSQRAGHSARTCPQPDCIRLGAAQAPQPADPAEGRGPGPRAPAAYCATLGKSPNLSGPRLSRSLVKARRRPGCGDPTFAGPDKPAHLQQRVRSNQFRSRPWQPHSTPVHQQRHRLGRRHRRRLPPAPPHVMPRPSRAPRPRTPRRLPGRGIEEKPMGRKASREM